MAPKWDNTNKTNNFKTVQDSTSYKTVYDIEPKKVKTKGGNGFGRSVALPFISGVLGCSVVLATCFCVPEIKAKLFEGSSQFSSSSSQSSENTGYVQQASLADYSDTSVYAANKILPSIVGIKVEYSVNSMLSMFGRSSTSTATASGSGIIISDDGYILTNNHIVSSTSSESYYEVSEATKVKETKKANIRLWFI